MIPKYKKIISYIEGLIREEKLRKGDKLPSINLLKKRFSLSRDTVLLALYDLKARGIIVSIPGKGYYLHNEDISCNQRIFLLFDELNNFKEDLYNSFIESLDDDITVDLFFHHFNVSQFSQIVYQSLGNYNYYIIMPSSLSGLRNVVEKLPFDKTYILDQDHEELKNYSGIYQNFEKDIYNALTNLKDHILPKYNQINFIYLKSKLPQGLVEGFERFCKEEGICNHKYNSIDKSPIEKGDLFLLLEDRDLIILVKKLKNRGFEIGKDVGVISYNESALKEIVHDGVTTISTNFIEMGQRLAGLIMKDQKERIENRNNVFLRNSI